MQMRNTILILVALLFLSVSCSVGPEPINYGSDTCHYCKMNVVDNQYAAELVTKKGKAFKYDAIECMLNEMKEIKEDELALYLTNTFDAPGELIDASKVSYLISENMPSPMGANLSAFKDEKLAKAKKEEKNGDIYNWEELKKKFSVK